MNPESNERRIQIQAQHKEQTYVYLFIDAQNNVGGEAIKFASHDIKKVQEFISDYVMTNKVYTDYFEIKKMEVTQ